MKMTRPDRPTPQFAFSARDVAYLESQGWKREELPPVVDSVLDQLGSVIELCQKVAEVEQKRRGRPPKAKA